MGCSASGSSRSASGPSCAAMEQTGTGFANDGSPYYQARLFRAAQRLLAGAVGHMVSAGYVQHSHLPPQLAALSDCSRRAGPGRAAEFQLVSRRCDGQTPYGQTPYPQAPDAATPPAVAQPRALPARQSCPAAPPISRKAGNAMASYPPPPPPPYNPPPPYGFDPRQQQRFLRDQLRVQERARKDAYRAQRELYREQTRSLRRSSIVGPLIVLGIGILALFISSGRLPFGVFVDVIPRSCSCSIQSMVAVPSCTSPIR